jgi:hypothetical protein
MARARAQRAHPLPAFLKTVIYLRERTCQYSKNAVACRCWIIFIAGDAEENVPPPHSRTTDTRESCLIFTVQKIAGKINKQCAVQMAQTRVERAPPGTYKHRAASSTSSGRAPQRHRAFRRVVGAMRFTLCMSLHPPACPTWLLVSF